MKGNTFLSFHLQSMDSVDGLGQDANNCSALTMELLL